jgi:hypothetical protein
MSIDGLKRMNWLKRLNYADKANRSEGGLSNEEYKWIRKQANDWPTCACGTLCKKLPRHEGGMPVDDYLREWGADFFWEVANRNFKAAKKTFLKIEARSTRLLEKMAKKA